MNGGYLTLSQAAQQAPGRVHASALWRWCRRGLCARNGQRIRLPHLRVGGRIYVKADELEAFFRAVAEADTEYFDKSASVESGSRSPKGCRDQRSAELDQIDRELDEAGL